MNAMQLARANYQAWRERACQENWQWGRDTKRGCILNLTYFHEFSGYDGCVEAVDVLTGRSVCISYTRIEHLNEMVRGKVSQLNS